MSQLVTHRAPYNDASIEDSSARTSPPSHRQRSTARAAARIGLATRTPVAVPRAWACLASSRAACALAPIGPHCARYMCAGVAFRGRDLWGVFSSTNDSGRHGNGLAGTRLLPSGSHSRSGLWSADRADTAMQTLVGSRLLALPMLLYS